MRLDKAIEISPLLASHDITSQRRPTALALPIWVLFGGALLLVLAVGLRWRAAAGDLWLDELVTLDHLRHLDSPLAIIWGRYFDNSHPLNSLYLYLLPDAQSPQVLRGLSILAGAVTVLFVAMLGRRRGVAGFFIYGTIFALSFPFVHFSSEARGYGSLMAFWCMAIYLVEPSAKVKPSRVHWLLPLVSVLGLLSHLFFLAALAVLALWHLERRLAEGEGVMAAYDRVMADFRSSCWAVALLLTSMLWAWRRFGMEFGGLPSGDIGNLPWVLEFFGASMARVFGLGDALPHWLLAVLVPCGLISLFLLHRSLAPERAQAWRAFYVLHLLIVPLLFLKFGHLRYQIFFAAALLFLLADVLTTFWQQARPGHWVAIALMVLFSVGQLWQFQRFLQDERGMTVSLLRHMAAETQGPEVTVGGFHAMAEKRLISGAERWLPPSKNFRFVGFEENPEWILVRRGGRALRLCDELELRAGPANPQLLGPNNAVTPPDGVCPWHIEMPFPDGKSRHYRLIGQSTFWGLAGMHTAVFRLVPPGKGEGEMADWPKSRCLVTGSETRQAACFTSG